MNRYSFLTRFQANSGQTLIEVVIAVGLVVLVLTTLASGIAIGVKNNRVARDQAAAKDYVRESLEWTRNMRDQAGWETFAAIVKTSGPYCLSSLPTTYQTFSGLNTGACSSGNVITGTSFKRQLTFTKGAGTPPSQITILAEVTWVDGLKTFKSESSMTLYLWK